MAGEEYIKVAADNIQRAIVAKKAEVQDIRNQLAQLENSKHQKLNELNQKINQNNVRAASSDTDDSDQARLLRDNMQLESEKSDTEHHVNAEKLNLEQQIRDKEEEWRNLEQAVHDLLS